MKSSFIIKRRNIVNEKVVIGNDDDDGFSWIV